jgi:hypothetical protein
MSGEALRPGAQIFVDGVPVELLYQTAGDGSIECWRCRLLFVEGVDHEPIEQAVKIDRRQSYAGLHSAPRARPA